jgi:hypothetical protein
MLSNSEILAPMARRNDDTLMARRLMSVLRRNIRYYGVFVTAYIVMSDPTVIREMTYSVFVCDLMTIPSGRSERLFYYQAGWRGRGNGVAVILLWCCSGNNKLMT